MTNVNGLQAQGAATGFAPQLGAIGSDANIDLLLATQGTGAIRTKKLKGLAGALAFGRLSKALADANYALLVTEYDSSIMEFTGALTAGRNVTVPLTDGAVWIVFNNTTGGFALTFIGATGTGVAVAAGKRAVIYCDGTNVVRVTADA